MLNAIEARLDLPTAGVRAVQKRPFAGAVRIGNGPLQELPKLAAS